MESPAFFISAALSSPFHGEGDRVAVEGGGGGGAYANRRAAPQTFLPKPALPPLPPIAPIALFFSRRRAIPPMKNGGPCKGAAAFLSACRRDQKAQRAPIEATRAEPSAVPRRCEVVAAGVPA